jgi:hypothetical protein
MEQGIGDQLAPAPAVTAPAGAAPAGDQALAVPAGVADQSAAASGSTLAPPVVALDPAVVEQVVAGGDLARLTPAQRVAYYHAVCQSLGLNPLTQPFEYIRLQDRLRLYAKRDATDQLRRLHRISVEIAAREQQGDLYVVTARASTPDGRTDEAIGAVSLAGLSGANLGNAVMRCETKAKRRVTLSICGLGWMDESEVETVRVARRVTVAPTGEIVDEAPAPGPPARASVSELGRPGEREPDGRIERLRRRWQALCAEADGLGLEYAPLPPGAPAELIVERGTALRRRVEAARAEPAADERRRRASHHAPASEVTTVATARPAARGHSQRQGGTATR